MQYWVRDGSKRWKINTKRTSTIGKFTATKSTYVQAVVTVDGMWVLQKGKSGGCLKMALQLASSTLHLAGLWFYVYLTGAWTLH